jgi:hypothetical protein
MPFDAPTSILFNIAGDAIGVIQDANGAYRLQVQTIIAPSTGAVSSPLFIGGVGTLPGVIKNSTGNLYRVWITNRNATIRYLQIFNNITGPSGTPLASYLIGANTGVINIDFGLWGNNFSVGISLGVSTSNTTYIAATGSETDWSCFYL